MTWGQAHLAAAVALAEAHAIAYEETIDGLLDAGMSAADARREIDSQVNGATEHMQAWLARLTRLFLDPSAPDRLQ